MTPEEAKEILVRYRGSNADADDPEIAEALRLACADPSLTQWLAAQRESQSQIRQQLRAIEPPANLKSRILAEIPSPANILNLWTRREFLAAAAAIVLLLGGAILLSRPANQRTYENFRARMVSFALRTYQMDILTNDPAAVRQHLARAGAPSDFPLPPALAKLPVKGGGRLSWQNQPVAMICFNLPANETAYMFVLDEKNLPASHPSTQPTIGQQKKLATVEWTAHGKIYLLAANTDPSTLAALAAPLPVF